MSRKEWYSDPRLIVVIWACFKQKHVDGRVFGETICDCESTRTASDDYLSQLIIMTVMVWLRLTDVVVRVQQLRVERKALSHMQYTK